MTNEALEALAAGLRGTAITPDHDAYEDARHVWNGTVDKRPALIVRCAGVADVIDGVSYAREHGLAVAVRGGGHHVAGGASIDGGVVIDLSEMRSVRVDPAAGTARVEGGAKIGDVDRETQAFGLAVPLGVAAETGIAGLTLAGGYGWLRRKHGLSCDNLIGTDVVTADGKLLHASASENPDLFWALRGGGWDLGVVTSFEYRAHPVGPEVSMLFVMYAHEDAARVLAGMQDYLKTAPVAASPVVIFWTFPPSEPFPQEVWGRKFVGIAAPYPGSVEEGERVWQPLRELATPLVDMSGTMPFAMIQHMFDEDYPKGRRYYWKSTYINELTDASIAKLMEIGAARPSPISSLDVWPLGGAISRVAPGDTPISQRDAPYLIGLEANWDDPAADAANIAWARDGVVALAPFSTGATYLNFEDDASAVAKSHGANFDRLAGIKRKYDPTNLFRSRRGLVD